MKATIFVLVLGALPGLSMAAGDHQEDHRHGAGHGPEVGHTKPQQASAAGMHDMSHERHESDAGRPGDPSEVSQTIEVTMDDTMRFSPDELKFKAGETVRFVVRNSGKIRHEMVIGSAEELKEHAEMMRRSPAMQHAEPNMVSLAPGEHGEVVWKFVKPGDYRFSCLVPGHLEAGMTGEIEVD